MVNKKGQFKIQQTAFMLLALALFFILIFVFWISIKTQGMKTTATSLEEEKAILAVESIAGLTEFSCGKQYCIDSDKLMILKSMKDYADFWPANSIKIRKVYPESNKEVECTLSNYPNCNSYTIKAGGESSVGTFVALCRQERINGNSRQVCDLGRIAIGYDVK
jgi:hypothetical protein